MTNNRKNQNIPTEQENPLFHDTWKLLKNYRDAVWNLELAVQQVRNSFEIEFGSSIEVFLDSIYLAGADIGGTKLENYAKSIERSNKMLNLLNFAVDILRSKHKHGEQYYWILYYSYLSPQQLQNTDEIIEKLRPPYCKYLPPDLLPQASGGGCRTQFYPVGLYLQGLSGYAGAILS